MSKPTGNQKKKKETGVFAAPDGGWVVGVHASTEMGEAVAMAQHDEARVAQAFPLPLELRTVCPEELEYL